MAALKAKTRAQGSKVDLTLQSIHGIECSSKSYRKDSSNMTAAVYFRGSAANMQVSSFTMCGRTGNVVIESEPMERDQSGNDHEISSFSESKTVAMVAHFTDTTERIRSFYTNSGSTLPCNSMSSEESFRSASSRRPHLQLKLSESNPHVPGRSLAMVNRDSSIVKPLDTEDKSNSFEDYDDDDFSRGLSLQWEEDGGAMPDIIELHITLRDGENVMCQEGLAHLVLFGSHGELGSTTMDLKIKTKLPQDQKIQNRDLESPCATLSSDAFIRITVDVASDDQPPPSPEEIVMSENFDEKKIGNIMSRLREHEEIAAARAKAHKMNFENKKDFDDPKNFVRRFFCNGGADLKDSFRVFVDAFTRCNLRKSKRGEQYHGHNEKDFIPILRASSTMESTIETRESMLL